MILKQLFEKIPFAEILSGANTKISGVATDSRMVEPGDLFIPVIGRKTNGYRFLAEALEKGATAIAGDEVKSRKGNLGCVHLPKAQQYVPLISAMAYGNPSRMLEVIGITGTSGKTTTGYLIEAILREIQGDAVGYIGDIEYRWAKSHQESKYSTPPAPQLQRILRKMVESQVRSLVLECSSIGLAQGRVDYTQFDIALFTNLASDHLDYHQDFVSYRNAKWKLFSTLLGYSEKKKKIAIFNADDPIGRSWVREHLPRIETITYSTDPKSGATVFTQSYKLNRDSIEATVHISGQVHTFKVPLIGLYNLQNVLASLAVAHSLRIEPKLAVSALQKIVRIPGRMEKVHSTANIEVFIDYAHTPAMLETSLSALAQIKKQRIITVFGCGGERDWTKRSKMGSVAASKSDFVILTSDNPRNEDPQKIIDEISEGIPEGYPSEQILKREEAIFQALKMAKQDDIVLIAGRGHEITQLIKDLHHPSEDRKTVRSWFAKK